MNKEISTQITINASAEKVWEVLTNFSDYPNWNPFIVSLTGEVKKGNTISVKLQGMSFKPKVLVYESEKQLTWLGHLYFKGLFDGEHSFRLENNEDGSSTFYHSEKFTGLLVRLFSNMLDTKTVPGFSAMNDALKQQVESN